MTTNDMTSVTKHDANAYCEMLSTLGMEEEGDPVLEVRRLMELQDQYNQVRQCCMAETVRATRLMGIVADLRSELDHKDQIIANLCTAMRRASVASGSRVVAILLEELDGPDAKDIPPRQEALL